MPVLTFPRRRASARPAVLFAYELFLGAGGIVCLVTAGLWLAASLLGLPLP